MKSLTRNLIFACAITATVGAAAFALTSMTGAEVEKSVSDSTDRVTTDFEFVKESEYPTAAASASMETYSSLAEMSKNAILIAEVKIKDQRTENVLASPPLPVTWSEAEVKEVYKGDKALKSVVIGEVGGTIDSSKSKPVDKKSNGTPIKSESVFEYTVQGSPVMKKGNTYLVLLEQSTTENAYAIVGTVQGKIRVSDTTNQGVVTIDPDTFAKQMNELFWFQRTFAGKDKAEIANILKNL